MNDELRTAEIDPFGADTLGTRVRFELAYAGSWLLLGWTLVKDGLVDVAAGRQYRPNETERAA